MWSVIEKHWLISAAHLAQRLTSNPCRLALMSVSLFEVRELWISRMVSSFLLRCCSTLLSWLIRIDYLWWRLWVKWATSMIYCSAHHWCKLEIYWATIKGTDIWERESVVGRMGVCGLEDKRHARGTWRIFANGRLNGCNRRKKECTYRRVPGWWAPTGAFWAR